MAASGLQAPHGNKLVDLLAPGRKAEIKVRKGGEGGRGRWGWKGLSWACINMEEV